MVIKRPKQGAKVEACPVLIARVIEGTAYNSNFNLCGSNQQLGVNTFVYSTECCEKNDNKECISVRQCRRSMANCVQRDDQGEVVSLYKAYGVKDCGACGAKGANGAPMTLGI